MKKTKKLVVEMKEKELISLESLLENYKDSSKQKSESKVIETIEKGMQQGRYVWCHEENAFSIEKVDENNMYDYSDSDGVHHVYDPELPYLWNYIPGKTFKISRSTDGLTLGFVYKK